jgi:hypothetical protein
VGTKEDGENWIFKEILRDEAVLRLKELGKVLEFFFSITEVIREISKILYFN